jgi:hypothetical protein
VAGSSGSTANGEQFYQLRNFKLLKNYSKFIILPTQCIYLFRAQLALTSPTSGGRSVGIVRWRTKAPEFVLFFLCTQF